MESDAGDQRATSPRTTVEAVDRCGSPRQRVDHEGSELQGRGFHAQWSERFAVTVRAALEEWDDALRDVDAVAAAIVQTFGANAHQRVAFTEACEPHTPFGRRIAECIHPGKADSWESKKRSALGAALV